MNKKISVIMPIYNCRDFLSRAVDSVINQPDFCENELVLVDDGSSDGSSDICDSYAGRFDNIKVIHQKNSGVSVARNIGISHAEGEWICFIDSDDYLLEDAFSKMFKFGEADIICAKHISDGNIVTGYETHLTTGFYNKNEINDQLDKILASLNSYFFTCWAKLFKREIIIENNICFPPDRKLAEDMVFVYTYIRACKTISLVDEAVYCYFVNDLNTTSVVPKSFETYLFIYNWKYEYFSKTYRDITQINEWLISSFLFKSFLSLKTAGTYLKYKTAVDYISLVLNNETFYSLYTSSNEYTNFKTKADLLLDKFIRQKKPFLIYIMYKLINLKTMFTKNK